MAEQIAHDVVKDEQLMGDPAPISASGATTDFSASAGDGQALPPPNDFSAPSKSADNAAAVEQGVGAEEARMAIASGVEGGVDGSLQVLNEGAATLSSTADLSGGSDTDTSRPDGLDASKYSGGHIRSNSIKKPTTFKSVSVTKSFLAKSATASPAVKGADSRGPSPATAGVAAQISAKPRLVAKSGSGGLAPRAGLKANGGIVGPDASKVWNKNRPVAPPPPKQFTDEELKQQYGIHMATRLQADESRKESTWADIDDDEDDWAPETVEWMDGTKSSVVPGENTPTAVTPVEEPKPAQMPLNEKVEATKLPASAFPRPSSTSGTKTILKPGGHTQPSASSPTVTNGIQTKSLSEKPTLVAKAAAPLPAKSPWATLPPVDRTPPVAPPVQPPPQSRFAQRDPHGFDSLPPLSAAKEIAADDFKRDWRDDQSNRTLFDSKSGRYEPVNDTRRGSTRDQGFRQPAVLQRPSAQEIPNAKGGPAEPSAAFQTSRTSTEGSWSRRRASSSLSGGSGSLARRMSIGRPQDMGAQSPLESAADSRQRRESGPGPSPVDVYRAGPPGPPLSGAPPQDVRAHPSPQTPRWSRPSPGVAQAQLADASSLQKAAGDREQSRKAADPPEPAQNQDESFEDPVARQQRMMREKIERARQAKQQQQEEEKREAEARTERLRLKMESLARASPDSSEVKAQGKARDEPSIAKATIDQPLPQQANNTTQPLAQSGPPPSQVPSPQKISTSPPKPPVPSQDGQITQYGLIKLHQPQTVRRPAQDYPFSGKPTEQQLQPHPGAFPPQPANFQASQQPAPSPHRSPQKPGLTPHNNPAMSSTSTTGSVPAGVRGWQQAALKFGARSSKDFKDPGNIWGSSTGGLGNGVSFQSNTSLLAKDDLEEPLSDYQKAVRAKQLADWGDMEENERKLKDERQKPYFDTRHEKKEFPTNEFERTMSGADVFTTTRAGKNGEPAETITLVTWREGHGPRLTWGLPWPHDSKGNPLAFSSHSSKTGITTYPFLEHEKRQKELDKRYANMATDLGTTAEALKEARHSRFFGKEARLSSISLAPLRDSDPPPPDALSYEPRNTSSGATTFNVKLPPPRPIVKLPTPSRFGQHQKAVGTVPVSKPGSTPSLKFNAGPSQPIVQQPEILNKLAYLLGKGPDPSANVRDPSVVPELPGSFVPPHLRGRVRMAPLPVAADTVKYFDAGAPPSPARPASPTVSLPRTPSPTPINVSIANVPGSRGRTLAVNVSESRSKSITTKTMAEDDFLEDREFGSRPAVTLPKSPAVNAHLAQFYPKNVNSRFPRFSVDSVTVNAFPESIIDVPSSPQGTPTTINLPGMKDSKTKLVPNRKQYSSNGTRSFSGRGRGGKRPFGNDSGKSSENSRPGSRKTSNVSVPQVGQVSSPVGNNRPRTPRSGYRGRGRGGFGGNHAANGTGA